VDRSERAWLLLAIGGLFAILAGLASLAKEALLDGISYGAAGIAVLSVTAGLVEVLRARSARSSSNHAAPDRAQNFADRSELGATDVPPSGPQAATPAVHVASRESSLYPVGAEVAEGPADDEADFSGLYPPQIRVGAGEPVTDSLLAEYLLSFERADDPWAQANVHNLIGFLYERRAELARARASHSEALRLFRVLEDSIGESDSLNNLGVVHVRSGEYQQALECHRLALALRKGMDRKREANSYNNIGVAYARLDPSEARRSFAKALELSRNVGDARGEGKALNNLAVCHMLDTSLDRASDELKQSLDLRPETDRRGRAKTVNNIGLAQMLLAEDFELAYEFLEESIVLAECVEDSWSRRNTMRNMHLLLWIDARRSSTRQARPGLRGGPGGWPQAPGGLLRDGEVVAINANRLGSSKPIICILSSGSMSPEVSLSELEKGYRGS